MEEIIRNERSYYQQPEPQTEVEDSNPEVEKPIALALNLPYAGVKGEKLMSKLKKYVSKTVNKDKKVITMQTIYRSKRLGSNFNIKDKIPFRHQHNIVYHSKCPNKKCNSQYTGETRCRIENRSDQHHGKDNNFICSNMR